VDGGRTVPVDPLLALGCLAAFRPAPTHAAGTGEELVDGDVRAGGGVVGPA
jgi:hypothetical protein